MQQFMQHMQQFMITYMHPLCFHAVAAAASSDDDESEQLQAAIAGC